MKKHITHAWTPNQLIAMSKSLEEAFGGGHRPLPKGTHGRWTSKQLLNLSAAKALLFK